MNPLAKNPPYDIDYIYALRTVEVEELVVARLGSELLGVDHGLLKGLRLGRSHLV